MEKRSATPSVPAASRTARVSGRSEYGKQLLCCASKRLCGILTAEDLVNRKFHRLRPDELWVTDITRHRAREG